MFFALSKIAFFFAQPSSLVVFLILGGLGLAALGLRRFGRAVSGLGIAGLLVLTLTPLGPALLTDLENRFPVPSEAEKPAGIVLLGGFTHSSGEVGRGIVAVDGGVTAVFVVARLAKQWPDVPIVLSGGSNGLVSHTAVSEAEDMKRLLVDLGVSADRLRLEDRSRTTWENAVETHALVHPAPGARWLLVTQAFHMPRAVAAFRAAGWIDIVAYPGSYATSGRVGLRPPMLWGLSSADLAVKEWLGLLAYRSTGRAAP